jgi:CspA family cold shock protein
MSSDKDVTPSAASEHLLGRVKWFNNKAGYGFITVTDGPKSGTDIFVHHSAINVENQQYKYLVQGEYVEFHLVKTVVVISVDITMHG